jgi:ferredoxin
MKRDAQRKYYIAASCIGCSLCSETAPGNFQMDYEDGFGYVIKQPETPAEESLCLKAMASCPTSAIGNNGMKSSNNRGCA